MITYEDIRQNEAIRTYITLADEYLAAIGYTDHSFSHVELVSTRTAAILEAVGRPEREVELGRIAGYMHDIGNIVNRSGHAQSGALLAFRLLDEMGMPPEEIAAVVTAIGNHDENEGAPATPLAAALILADKSDVRAGRVRHIAPAEYDIHDRVNMSVKATTLVVDSENKMFLLSLRINTELSPVIDYFDIFLDRMILCRRAAASLGLTFTLQINGQRMM